MHGYRAASLAERNLNQIVAARDEQCRAPGHVAQRFGQVGRARHALAVDADHEVAFGKPRAFGQRAGLDRCDHGTANLFGKAVARLLVAEGCTECGERTASAALAALRFATARGFGDLDPARFAATGGSAGAGISLWLGFRDDLAEPDSDLTKALLGS